MNTTERTSQYDPAIRELREVIKLCKEKCVDEEVQNRLEKVLKLAQVSFCRISYLFYSFNILNLLIRF